MLKYVPVAVATIALGVFVTFDYLGYRERSVELASLDMAARKIDAEFEVAEVSYTDHLLSKVGITEGLPVPSLETAKLRRQVLRAAPLNSYFPQASNFPEPSKEGEPGWERIAWRDDFHTGFGWPDGMTGDHTSKYAPDTGRDIAIYLHGRSSIYLRAEFAEPTETLAERLQQSYWVVETGRSLDRLREGRPRASYFWTNIEETSKGESIYNAKDQEHFHAVNGVYWLMAKDKTARRDEKMRYMFASLGSGVVLKLRAHAPEDVIKQVMDHIDYQSLNQMQTLPSPLIADGLGEFVIDTPVNWLAAHGLEETADTKHKQASAKHH